LTKFLFFTLVLFLNSLLAFADGSFLFKSDLLPILQSEKILGEHFLSSYDFSESGSASRLGNMVNPNLAGARVGPYCISGKLKGSEGQFNLKITIDTNVIYFDSNGKVSTIEKATKITETFKSFTVEKQ